MFQFFQLFNNNISNVILELVGNIPIFNLLHLCDLMKDSKNVYMKYLIIDLIHLIKRGWREKKLNMDLEKISTTNCKD
jgi:hypothetical protein